MPTPTRAGPGAGAWGNLAKCSSPGHASCTSVEEGCSCYSSSVPSEDSPMHGKSSRSPLSHISCLALPEAESSQSRARDWPNELHNSRSVNNSGTSPIIHRISARPVIPSHCTLHWAGSCLPLSPTAFANPSSLPATAEPRTPPSDGRSIAQLHS